MVAVSQRLVLLLYPWNGMRHAAQRLTPAVFTWCCRDHTLQTCCDWERKRVSEHVIRKLLGHEE